MGDLQITEPKGSDHVGIAMVSTRQVQEVQAAVVSAKRFPRDEIASHKRIIAACSRKGLAEVAMYSYPRGGTSVTGPSIRLAEALAQAWGNIDAGWVELERKPSMGNLPGESVVMAYAVDLETNYRKPITFTVRHWRDTKKGGYALNEERDIYELIANQAARRLRACILGVIPRDVQEDAICQCETTLKNDNEPLIDRVKKMVVAFGEFGVTQEALEKRLGHKMDATNNTELVNLRKIYTSIKDGFASRDEFFEAPQAGDVENPTPKPAPAAAAAEVRTVRKPKNHAPQTQEEAIEREREKLTAQNQPEAAAPEPKPEPQPEQPASAAERMDVTRKIMAQLKKMKITGTEAIAQKFQEVVAKAPDKCTTSELLAVYEVLLGEAK